MGLGSLSDSSRVRKTAPHSVTPEKFLGGTEGNDNLPFLRRFSLFATDRSLHTHDLMLMNVTQVDYLSATSQSEVTGCKGDFLASK